MRLLSNNWEPGQRAIAIRASGLRVSYICCPVCGLVSHLGDCECVNFELHAVACPSCWTTLEIREAPSVERRY